MPGKLNGALHIPFLMVIGDTARISLSSGENRAEIN